MAVIRDRARCDDDAPRMRADVPGHAPDHPRESQELGRQLVQAAESQGSGGAADILLAHAEGEGRFTQAAPLGEAAVVRDHGRPPLVIREDRGEDGPPLVPGKVDVDVGRILAPLVEEALEEEVVLEGIDVGEAQEVGDQARGGAPPAAGPGAARDDVAHDEEVGRKALVADDAQLSLEAHAERGEEARLLRAEGLPPDQVEAVAPPRPLLAERAQEVE